MDQATAPEAQPEVRTIYVAPQDYFRATMIMKSRFIVSSILSPMGGATLLEYASNTDKIEVDPTMEPNTWRCSDGTGGTVRKAEKPLVVLT